MKSRRGAILICGPRAWRLGAATDAGVAWIETGISPHADAAEIIEKLPVALERLPASRDRAIVLALSSEDCLAASIATSALPRSDRRRAMEYRLEGKLPLAIEEVAADFISHNGRALGVCVRTQTINATIDAVRRCGVQIKTICPAAILGFQGGLSESKPLESLDAVIWRADESANVFLLEENSLVQWYCVPATLADIGVILASSAMARGRPMRVALHGSDPQWSADIAGLAKTEVVSSDALSMDDAAFQTAARVLSEKTEPLINFRHQGLGGVQLRRPIVAAIAACLLLCFSLIGAAVWRGNRYANISAGYGDQERRLFQQLFPDEPVPPGVESRLQSYASQLVHASAAGSSGVQPSSLTLLYKVLFNLPADMPLQFDDLQFDSGRATLQGRAGSLAQASEIAAGLRRAKDIQVDDPQTQQFADGGVGFTISAHEGGLP